MFSLSVLSTGCHDRNDLQIQYSSDPAKHRALSSVHSDLVDVDGLYGVTQDLLSLGFLKYIHFS